MRFWWALCGIFLLLCAQTHAAEDKLVLSRVELTAVPDLGEAKITYRLTPETRSVNAGLQLFVHREDITGRVQYDVVSPANPDGSPLILKLFKGLDNTGTFSVPLKKGSYGAARLILFRSPDGKSLDFGQPLYDSASDSKKPALKLGIKIQTEQRRVTAPTFELPRMAEAVTNPDGTYRVDIDAAVKVPAGYTIEGNGLWAMARGSGGFSQVWVDVTKAQPGNSPLDPYRMVPIRFTLDRLKPGLWNVQFGLFKPSFGDALQWVYPGLDFEAGGDAWVVKAPEARIPPRLRVKNGRFVTLDGKPHPFYEEPKARQGVGFVRGGNYGNAITWTLRPEPNSTGYFTLLHEMGSRFMRVNFNADRYPEEPVYQHAVDQIVQNIWAAGMYPILAPQGLPSGSTREEQAEKGLRVVEAMARKYRGKSIWLELCNEPHEFGTWTEWKPVAIRYTKAVRKIDPDAFVIVPFEGYGKDGRAAAKDPIKEVDVDLYDGHAYVEPAQLSTLYGPAITAGLPVMLGEYGGDAAYLRKMHLALQQLPPGLLAAGPWAFTVAGQDKLPLVADGSTAELKLTPAGQAVAEAYRAWDAGKRLGP